MNIESITREEYEKSIRKKYNTLEGLLMEIQNTDGNFFEIKNFYWKNAAIGASSLSAAIKRYGMHSLEAKYANDRIFVIKK